MIFGATRLDDAWLIDIEPREDERGFFARTWCRQELSAQGLDPEIAQESLSYNRHCGTIRGLHFQRSPHEETKIVRCTRGAIFDVVVDLRPRSPTYLRWQGFELTAENRRAL
jgi:dTDP-4-dehydrorhamnose 3,5-epimerase